MSKLLFFYFTSLLFVQTISAQKKTGSISGIITDKNKQALGGITVVLINSTYADYSDFDGHFTIDNIKKNKYVIEISAIGFKKQIKSIDLRTKSNINFAITLEEDLTNIAEVTVLGKSTSTKIEEQGFNVKSVDLTKIQTQSLELNKVLAKTPGIRVRTTGGTGSDFEYSLDGLSGNAIKFFIDGIPMDYYGSSYSINNLPISLIKRIDIYKGVVPVDLGSDALGGAINLVTNQNVSNFLEGSYSFGSFNTHKLALHGQWKSNSGFTTRLSTFYTYSDNNYKVWGEGVFYADEETAKVIEITEDNAVERFNDDFETTSAKLDLGFTNKKWADQFFISLLVSDQKKGVQNGQNMGFVYGEMRNNEQVVMPSIIYKKKNFITKGLDINAFAGYSHTTGVVIDTTMNTYNWNGDIVLINPNGGELGRNGRSLYTQKDNSEIYRFNATYQLPSNFKLGLNYLYSNTKRTGEDPFASLNKLPYSQPQSIGSNFVGLSLETKKINNKLHANVFVKFYDFKSSINKVVYTTEYEIINTENNLSNWGGGFASSYKLSSHFLLKTSVEQATRLPTATEAIGDGVTVIANDTIKPEQSLNINFGVTLGRYAIGNHGVKIAVNTFYRDVSNKIKLIVEGGELGQGKYINIESIGGPGAEIDIVYDYNHNLKFNLNATYLGIRNTQEIDENGNTNLLLGDRLRNAPYFMANAGIDYSINNFIQKKSKTFIYLQSSYVHEFFLRWPSAGYIDSKDVVPTQLVFDAGISYTFPSEKLSVALDLSNMLNEQVYDNYLLQKPGRAIFAKINYQLSK